MGHTKVEAFTNITRSESTHTLWSIQRSKLLRTSREASQHTPCGAYKGRNFYEHHAKRVNTHLVEHTKVETFTNITRSESTHTLWSIQRSKLLRTSREASQHTPCGAYKGRNFYEHHAKRVNTHLVEHTKVETFTNITRSESTHTLWSIQRSKLLRTSREASQHTPCGAYKGRNFYEHHAKRVNTHLVEYTKVETFTNITRSESTHTLWSIQRSKLLRTPCEASQHTPCGAYKGRNFYEHHAKRVNTHLVEHTKVETFTTNR